MENFLVTLKFLGGLTILFAIGHLIGHLLKLDKFYEDKPEGENEAGQEMIHKN